MNKKVNKLRKQAKKLHKRYIEGTKKLYFPDATPRELLNIEEENRHREEEKRRFEMKTNIQRRLEVFRYKGREEVLRESSTTYQELQPGGQCPHQQQMPYSSRMEPAAPARCPAGWRTAPSEEIGVHLR